jgi:hypothetical protein
MKSPSIEVSALVVSAIITLALGEWLHWVPGDCGHRGGPRSPQDVSGPSVQRSRLARAGLRHSTCVGSASAADAMRRSGTTGTLLHGGNRLTFVTAALPTVFPGG